MRLRLGGSRGGRRFRIGRLSSGFGRGLGPRGGCLRLVLLETALLVFAAGAAMTRLVAPRPGARRSIHEVSVPLVGVSGAARPLPRPRATRGSLPAGRRARSAGSVRGPRRPGRNTASGGRRSSPTRACSRLRTTAYLFPHATPPGGCRRVARDPRTGSSSPGTFRRGSADRYSDVRSTNRPSRYCPAIAIVGAGPMSAARSSNDSMAHTSVRLFRSTSNLGFENVPMTCGAGFSDRMVSSSSTSWCRANRIR